MHPTPSSAGKSEETAGNLSKEGRETTRQEDMKRNEKESDEKQTEPQREEKEVAMPVEVVSLLEERLQENKIDEDDKIWPIIWDFAGQDIYRAIHPIFMSSEDIYLLVFDLRKELGLIAECRVNQGDGEHAVPARESKDSNLDHMMRWMDLIHSLKNCEGIETSSPELSLPPVIVVGTHADELEEDPRKKIELAETKWERVREAFPAHFIAHIKSFLPMDNTKAGEATGQEEIITLRRKILDLAYEMPHTMKEIPLQWHLLEKEIGKPIWQDREEPFLLRKNFQEEIVSRFCKADNEDDFDELLHFLHARGSIVYHEHLDENTGDKNGLVFLNPQWLINILCQIIKVESCKDEPEIIKQDRKILQSKGILSNRLLDRACRKLKLESIKHSLLSLMKTFNLICEWSTTKPEDSLILVPCMLTTTSEEGDTAHEGTSDSLAPVYLTFDGTNYVPGGLFSRLVVLFGEWLSDPQCRNEYELHANEATYALDEDHFLHLVCYKTIIKLRISAEGDAAPSDYPKNVLRHLMDFLKTLREECHWLHSMMAKLCARCTACAGKSDKNTTPCIRHGKPACRHYDCAHYLPLNSRVLCCRPGCPVPRKPLMPWIQALKSLQLTNNPGASAESSLKSPSTTTETQQESKRPRTMTETNSVKAGKVSDKDLQLLSGKLVGDKWKKLGRRLEVDEAKISAYHKQHEELDEKAYHMLRDWKERKGSGATYEVLYDALCDEERVACRNLAEEICCVQSS